MNSATFFKEIFLSPHMGKVIDTSVCYTLAAGFNKWAVEKLIGTRLLHAQALENESRCHLMGMGSINFFSPFLPNPQPPSSPHIIILY